MDLHRWLLAIGFVVGVQMVMAPSSIAHVFLNESIRWTPAPKALQSTQMKGQTASTVLVQSAQRQVNTVTLDAANLSEPHILTIETTADLNGDIVINGESVTALTTGTTTLDVAPYLRGTATATISITGSYSPKDAAIRLQFEGPNILVEQQSTGAGQLDYQLNLNLE